MKDQDSLKKLHDLEATLAQIESRARFHRGMNLALWGAAVALFGFYGFYASGLAKEVLSNEMGPRVLTQVARGIAPRPERVVAAIQAEIPTIVKRGLDTAESCLANLEAGLLAKLDRNADSVFSMLGERIRPIVAQAIQEDLPRIRALMERAKSEEGSAAVVAYVGERTRAHLAQAVRELDGVLAKVHARLAEFHADEGTFTKRHLAERQLLLSLLRLAEEPAVQEAIRSMEDD